MRTSIGTTGLSASGGSVTLIGRRGEGWQCIASSVLPIDAAVELLEVDGYVGAHVDPAFGDAVASAAAEAPRFASGELIQWRYGRNIEAMRVVRDDERGLITWIPTGSERLESVPVDGRRPREVPLAERFSSPWMVQDAIWTGPGIVRVAPTGRPWSVWFFRDDAGSPAGAYVNLELPHRRVGGEAPGVFSRDLVLDVWIDAAHPGSEDVWLKDEDELAASVEQGRFTAAQAEAIRVLADHATDEFIATGAWPLDEGWDRWQPDAALDLPAVLPDTAGVAAARLRTGATFLEG